MTADSKLTILSAIDKKPIPPEISKDVLFASVSGENYILVLTQNKLSFHQRTAISKYVSPREMQVSEVTASKIENLKTQQANESKEISETEAEEMFSELFELAVKEGASDIHIITYPDDPHIKIRVNGELERLELSKGMTFQSLTRMATSIYLSKLGNTGSNKNSFQPQHTQSGTVQEMRAEDGNRYRLRYQDAELDGDERCVHITLRLLDLDRDFINGDLTDLGFEADQQQLTYDVMLKGGGGLLILVGATGDGKTTTAATVLGHLVSEHQGRKNIQTVEDPVEFKIPGVHHTQVQPMKDESEKKAWERHLAAMMRRDPDFILQGEMRTETTASSACEAALTGHTTIVTLHGNSGFDAFNRLAEMNVPSSLLGTEGFIKGVIFQRLMPILCDHCSIPHSFDLSEKGIVSEALMRRIDQSCGVFVENIRFRNYEGCKHCRKGLEGREVAAETLIFDHAVRAKIAKGEIDAARVTWMDGKGTSRVLDSSLPLEENYPQHCVGFTAFDHAVKKMLQGKISPVDVEDKLDILTKNTVFQDESFSGSEVPSITGMKSAEPEMH